MSWAPVSVSSIGSSWVIPFVRSRNISIERHVVFSFVIFSTLCSMQTKRCSSRRDSRSPEAFCAINPEHSKYDHSPTSRYQYDQASRYPDPETGKPDITFHISQSSSKRSGILSFVAGSKDSNVPLEEA